MDQITPKPVKQFKVIGTRPLRPDGIEKVTGKAIYGADSVSYTHLRAHET